MPDVSACELEAAVYSDYPLRMELRSPDVDVYVPDGADLAIALARTTHMGIGAHPDDLEIIAFPGIAHCHDHRQAWFAGVVVCDGAGSPRGGPFADCSDAEMVALRRQEQRSAAALGRYSVQFQLGQSSNAVRSQHPESLLKDLVTLLVQCQPRVLYLHNLADAHDTHRATVRACIAALRELDQRQRPAEIYGVEVWRSLDWLPEAFRVALPIRDPDGLQAKLLRCHDSQISGGKRYDRAILARQQANATLAESHHIDREQACVLAMNLLPLVESPDVDCNEFLQQCLTAFSRSVLA